MFIGTNSLMEAVRFAYGWNMAEMIAGVRHHLAVMGESCESSDHFCLQFDCQEPDFEMVHECAWLLHIHLRCYLPARSFFSVLFA